MQFRIVLFVLILLALQWFIYFQFVKYLKTTKIYKPSHRYWAVLPFILFNVPFIIIALLTNGHFEPPEWLRATGVKAFYIWQGATIFIGLWLLIGKIIKLPFQIPVWILKIFKPMREKISRLKEKKPVRAVDLSRRHFVKYSTLAVSAYAFGGAAYGVLKHDQYEIDYKEIKIDNLPPELKGTTITLLSDIHAGQYMNEKDMREYADVVNSLGSDIICIPGDFVNSQRADAHPVAAAFRDLHARYGVYGSLGNHDFFQDPGYVADVLNNDSPIQVMRNQHRKINIKGHDVFFLGVDDTISSGTGMNRVVLQYFDDMSAFLKTNEPTFEKAPKILLCHKPYGFDDLAERDVDLILSGHTHGGQVVPVKIGDFNMSFAAMVSKYIEGHYKTGKVNMYVSRGIGTVGLPIRLNCPPEITKITLV